MKKNIKIVLTSYVLCSMCLLLNGQLINEGTADTVDNVLGRCNVYSKMIQLTELTNEIGGGWNTTKINLNKDFLVEGGLYFGDNDAGDGGIMFVLQNRGYVLDSLFGTGSDMGFHNYPQSLGVEFDMHQDNDSCYGDAIASFDHLTINTNGDLCNPLVPPLRLIEGVDDVETDNLYLFKIRWFADNHIFQVYVENVLRISVEIDLVKEIFEDNPYVHVGFVGATGDVATAYAGEVCQLPDSSKVYEVGCIVDADYTQGWYTPIPDTSVWNLKTFGAEQQSNSSIPSILLSQQKFLNIRASGRIRVVFPEEGTGFIGLAIGYLGPVTHPYTDYDFYTLDWKRFKSNGGQEGMTFFRMKGILDPLIDPEIFPNYFWEHQEGPANTILNTHYGPGTGWQMDVEYPYTIEYTADSIKLTLNGQTFTHGACFEPAQIGMYTYSQPNVRFNDFAYEQIEPVIKTSTEEACAEELLTFEYVYSNNCTSFGPEAFLDSIIWDFGNGKIMRFGPDSLPPIVQYAYPSGGSYELTLTIENRYGCRSQSQQQMTINALPMVDLGPDAGLCFEDIIYVDVSQQIGQNVTYLWSDSSTNPIRIFDKAGIYSVTITNGACLASDTIQITEYPNLKLMLATSESCYEQQNGTMAIQIEGGVPPYAMLLDGIVQSNSSIENLTPAVYALQVSDAVGCVMDTSFSITETAAPDYEYFITDSSCFGEDDGTLEILSPDSTLQFSLDGIMFTKEFLETDLLPGDYSFYVKDQFDCHYENFFSIIEPPLLKINLDTLFQINLGEAIPLMAEVADFDDLIITWSPDTTLSCNDCLQPMAAPIETTIYTIHAQNELGCMDTASTVVEVNSPDCLFIPNVFTPDNNGINDRLIIQAGSCRISVERIRFLRIFNRWGAVVFEAQNFQPDSPLAAWGGKIDGALAPSAVYVYQLEASYIDGRTVTRQGSVTLYRNN